MEDAWQTLEEAELAQAKRMAVIDAMMEDLSLLGCVRNVAKQVAWAIATGRIRHVRVNMDGDT